MSDSMRDYVQVPAAEPEKPYELTSTREPAALLCLSRSGASAAVVLTVPMSSLLSHLRSWVIISVMVTVATVFLTLSYL